jgi:hypothetical protein
MTERELVALAKKNNEQALLTLWNKYDKLVHKHWHVLRRQLNTSSIIMDYKDDFYSDAYIAFRKAVAAVDLKKINDDNWKLLGYFGWYLQTLRTNLVKSVIRKYDNEESLYISNPNQDHEILKTDLHYDTLSPDIADEIVACEDIYTIRSRWDKPRQFVFDQRVQGVPKKDIAAALGVHPSMVSFYLRSMKKDLSSVSY